jgi:3-dehydroquinate dehydratase
VQVSQIVLTDLVLDLLVIDLVQVSQTVLIDQELDLLEIDLASQIDLENQIVLDMVSHHTVNRLTADHRMEDILDHHMEVIPHIGIILIMDGVGIGHGSGDLPLL